MQIRKTMMAGLLSLACVLPAAAEDSAQRASTVSGGLSAVAAYAVGWTAYQGSELVVTGLRASGQGVELVLQGASGAIETSAHVSAQAVEAASLGVGRTVKVVADSTGYSLVAAGVLLAYVPNEIGRALLHHARY